MTTVIAMGAAIKHVISSLVGVPMFHTSMYLFLLLAFAAARTRDDPLGSDW